MVKVIYSSIYNEYKVVVSGSTYYTYDEQDALVTCSRMMQELGVMTMLEPVVTKARVNDEFNW